MAINKSDTLSNLLPKFIAKAKLKTLEAQVFRQYVDVVQHNAGQGRVYNEPTFGRLNAYAGSEGVEVGIAQAFTDSNTAWTPTEHVAQFVVTKRALFVNTEPILRHGEMQLSRAHGERQDQQITSLFSSAGNTNTDLGSAGAALAVQDVFAAKNNVIAASDTNYGKLPTDAGGQIIFAAHPLSLYDIEADILAFSSSTLGTTTPLDAYAADVFKEGFTSSAAGALRGHLAGTLVVQSTNIVPDASDDAANIVYGRDSFVLVESGEMGDNIDETVLSGRGVEVTTWQWYVAAERTDAWAQPITADAAAAA